MSRFLLVLALRRPRHEDRELEASLGYIIVRLFLQKVHQLGGLSTDCFIHKKHLLFVLGYNTTMESGVDLELTV